MASWDKITVCARLLLFLSPVLTHFLAEGIWVGGGLRGCSQDASLPAYISRGPQPPLPCPWLKTEASMWASLQCEVSFHHLDLCKRSFNVSVWLRLWYPDVCSNTSPGVFEQKVYVRGDQHLKQYIWSKAENAPQCGWTFSEALKSNTDDLTYDST